jgi:hypothetical protein
VASGIWDSTEYQKLVKYDGEIHEQSSTAVFMCHQQDGCVCSGWLGHRERPEDMLAVRLGLLRGDLDESCLDYTTDVPLFESGAQAAEHGMERLLNPGEDAISTIDKIIRRRGQPKATQALRRPDPDATSDRSSDGSLSGTCCALDKMYEPDSEEEVAMATAPRRRLPIPAATEQDDRLTTPEQRRELAIDTMASWALEGMQPTRQAIENINAYVRGEVTIDEYLRKLKGS